MEAFDNQGNYLSDGCDCEMCTRYNTELIKVSNEVEHIDLDQQLDDWLDTLVFIAKL